MEVISKWSVRSAVRSIAWLDVRSPSVNQSSDNQTADAAENKNGNVLVGDDGVGKADQQTEQETHQPARPARELDAANDESNGKATAKSAEQCRRLVRERHRQHEDDIQRSEDDARHQNKNNFRHAEFSNGRGATTSNETEISHARVSWQSHQSFLAKGALASSLVR